MGKKIAVTIQNFVQFYSLKPFLDLRDYNIDIYVPDGDEYNLGVKRMHDDIYSYLVEHGYNVFRKPKKNLTYQILLEPYPMDIYFRFDYKYRIKYKYASISAKPKITYNILENILYDAVLCYSTYEQEILNNFTKTFLVGRLCFIDFEKKNLKNKKKTILYLPTYGEYNYIDDVVSKLKKLSNKYNIITKEHHGTNYLYSEKKNSETLKGIINKFYDSSYPLSELLEISDVVLTDNSGSIFEALYTNIPVCIFSKNIEKCNFNKLESLQFQLVKEDVIPFTNDECEIENIISKALSDEYQKKQKQVSNNLFSISYCDALKSFTTVIDNFLNGCDNNLNNRIILHREIQNYINSIVDKNNELINNNQILNDFLSKINIENIILKNKVDEYENGKLYKISTKVYSFKSKFRRKNK